MDDYIVYKSQKDRRRTIVRRNLSLEDARKFCQDANVMEPKSINRYFYEFTRDN